MWEKLGQQTRVITGSNKRGVINVKNKFEWINVINK